MSRFDGDQTIVVPPMGTEPLVLMAQNFIEGCLPGTLDKPQAVNIIDLIEAVAIRHSIVIQPVSRAELGRNTLALTLSEGAPNDWIDINVEELHYETLYETDSRSNRARSTVAHELGHARLHIPYVREYSPSNTDYALPRRELRSVATYMQPEWQAWAFGLGLLVPLRTLLMLPRGMLISEIAELYGVSEKALNSHLGRLQRAGLIQK